MSQHGPVSLQPVVLEYVSPEYRQDVCSWPFEDPYVTDLLQFDIPRRSRYGGQCTVWGYRNQNQQIVGVGTMDVCTEYGVLTENREHCYIPILAVHPQHRGHHYGEFIVQHLVDEAAVKVAESNGSYHGLLFLDVYTSNTVAITLYEKKDFRKVSDDPEYDSKQNRPYYVMVRDVTVAA